MPYIIRLSTLAGQGLSELEEKPKAAVDALKRKVEELKGETPVVNADTKSEPQGEDKITEDQATEAKDEDNHTDDTKEKSKEEDASLTARKIQRKARLQRRRTDNHTGDPKEKSEEDSKKKEKSALPSDAGQRKGKVYEVDEGHSDDDDDGGVNPPSFRRRTVFTPESRCFRKIGTDTPEIRFKIFLPLLLEATGHLPSNCEVFLNG